MLTEPAQFHVKTAQTEDLASLMDLYGHLHADDAVDDEPTLSQTWAEIKAHPGLGHELTNEIEMGGADLVRYKAQTCRKPSGFQRFATLLLAGSAHSFQDAETALI